jgi:hypothetical protein
MALALRSLVLVCALLVHPLSRADAVADWNKIALDTVVQSRQPLEYKLRAMAMVHVAMFEALNFVQARYTPHFIVASPTLTDLSIEAVAAAAAHHVLVDLYPNQSAALAAALRTSLDALPGRRDTANDVITGTSIAAVICAVRASEREVDELLTDRRTSSSTASPKGTTAPTLEPWVLKSVSQLRPVDPIAPRDAPRTLDDNDVDALGVRVGAARTDIQTGVERFWSLTTPLNWNPMVAELISSRGLSLIESARIHALIAIVVADAYTAALDAQYSCAPCIAATAAATILASEVAAAGNASKAVTTDQAIGREIARSALEQYFRPLPQPASRASH